MSDDDIAQTVGGYYCSTYDYNGNCETYYSLEEKRAAMKIDEEKRKKTAKTTVKAILGTAGGLAGIALSAGLIWNKFGK